MTRHDQWKFLDNLRRRALVKHELRRALLRSATRSQHTPLIHRYKSSFGLVHAPRRSSITKVRNRCTVTGRTWNVIKRAQYSRFAFRTNSYFSFMPGVRRASW